jgi:hypothetical protein
MTNAWFYQFEIFQQRPEPGYIVTSPLTATIEPLVEYLPDMMEEIMQALVVAPDTIVLPVPSQLLALSLSKGWFSFANSTGFGKWQWVLHHAAKLTNAALYFLREVRRWRTL